MPLNSFQKRLVSMWTTDDETLNSIFHSMRLELGWRSDRLAKEIATVNQVTPQEVWSRIFNGETNAT